MEQHDHCATSLQISGMHCHSCAKNIEKALKSVPGVEEANVNFATEKATVHTSHAIDPALLTSAVKDAGYGAAVIDAAHSEHLHHGDEDGSFFRFMIALVATLPFLVQMAGMLVGWHLELPLWLQLILASVVQFFCGWSFYRASYFSARSGSFNMDVLIVLGTTAAYLFSIFSMLYQNPPHLYFETSASIITLVLLGRWLESKTKGQASRAIAKLAKIQPKVARVERDGKVIDLPIEQIISGNIIHVRAGERIPVDAVVIEGHSEVDESMVTGESVPVIKAKGSKVFAGTMNQEGSLRIRAEQVGADTVLASIIRLVENAQESKAPVQRLADQVAEVFVPAVLLISMLTFFGWWLYGNPTSDALIKAVAVLVIACPCALGLATPIVIVAASGRAAELGVIFKDASAIETAHKIEMLCFDKTGTVTEGKPVVTDLIPSEKVELKELLQIALSLENHVQHPLSKAIVKEAKKYALHVDSVHNFQYIAGKGIIGSINEIWCGVGTPSLAKEKEIPIDKKSIESLQNEGKTVSVVWKGKTPLGYIAIRDQVREDAPQAIKELERLKIRTVMLTGDHEATAKAIAERVGIEEYRAEMKPDQKVAFIVENKERKKIVGMVGDGINDAPALAAADVGIAMGAGSDVAMETAQIGLLRNEMMGVVDAIRLSKTAFTKIKQNLFFAFIYNILGIPLAAMGFLNPIIAAAAMAMSSLSVVLNALSLTRWR